MSDTRTDLVKELQHLVFHAKPGATKIAKVRKIMAMALRGEYHDFKSPHAMPKVLLVQMLRDASLATIATRVINGEFDEKADAEDCAALAIELKDEPELRRMLQLPDPIES